MKAGLYFHTIRHLRIEQIVGRLRHRFQHPCPNLAPPPPCRVRSGCWSAPCERKQSMLAGDRFIFLNEERALISANTWNDPDIEKLWLYNLHYFDDLNAESAETRRSWHQDLIERWIKDNPPVLGNGWEPYPSSLRIVNWIKFALNGGVLSEEAIHSLAVQIRYLCERLEFHLLGNHLLANAKALVFAGVFFDGPEAESWLIEGRDILKRELKEQILVDGGHFELSPMYHCIILEDLLDITNICNAYAIESQIAARVIGKMESWLSVMTHPDGEISFFNDAAFGVAPNKKQLGQYAERLDFSHQALFSNGITRLVSSGYVRMDKGFANVLLDVASVGPSYLPGHAHADTLSFEFSLNGFRLIVNSGTSCYGNGAERHRQRGTKAHSTLCINDEDSSEVWGGFRVARRAKVHSIEVAELLGDLHVRASHDGYKRLTGVNTHSRSWHLSENELIVDDEIAGTFEKAEVRFHFHPDVEFLKIDGAGALLRSVNGEIVAVNIENGTLRMESGTWHPYFGLAVPNICLVSTMHDAQSRTIIKWKDAR
ncbi:MAG: heparinase [Sideroxydans sp.]|nr:heparinase [Sideroxydans sp.]